MTRIDSIMMTIRATSAGCRPPSVCDVTVPTVVSNGESATQLVAQFEETYETRQKTKKRHDFSDWIFEKERKNVEKHVEVITYMLIVLKTTVTTLNQFCCLSHNSKVIIF